MKETDDSEPDNQPECGEAEGRDIPEAQAEDAATAVHGAEPIDSAPPDALDTNVPAIADPAEAVCQETPLDPAPEARPSDTETPEKLICEMSKAEKGEFGERVTKEAMEKEGYEAVGSHIKPQGIDSVWVKDENVVLVETKFLSEGDVRESNLKNTAEGQQTSMEWTFMKDNEDQPTRIREACGDRTEEILDKMIEHGYATRVAAVDGEGTLKFQDVDTQAKGGIADDEGKVRLDAQKQDTPDAEGRVRSYFH